MTGVGDETSPSQAEHLSTLDALTACAPRVCALPGEEFCEDHKKFKWELKAPNLHPASAVQHPPPSQLLNLCGEQPLSQYHLEMPYLKESLLQGSPLLAVAVFSGCLTAHRVTFPTSHKDACALCPPNTDKGPQAVAAPMEGAPEPKSDGGPPEGPGDPFLLLEEQRANSPTPVCKAKKSYWCYSERREPNSAANKRRKEDQR